ncbi:MAG: ATP-binding protein [Butyrivibrio sp.]|nr:ATP-binding protein [Butyrivibrio sp.]
MALTNSQYDEIMRGYGAKQTFSRRELDRRTAEVTLRVPEYGRLASRIGALASESAKASIHGNTSELDGIRGSIDEIRIRMNTLLTEGGFPSDYLEPVYECPLCKDTGYIGNKKCRCFKQAAIDLLYRQSNIRKILQSENFDAFCLDYFNPDFYDNSTGLSARENAEKLREACKEFVDAFPAGDNILFYGNTGVGKTFLSNCIAKALLDKSFSVLYLSAIELFNILSEYDKEDSADSELSESQITGCDLLIIDDLGTELSNAFTNSKLFYCINDRLLKGKSTVISTNLSPGELMNNYSERIFSRIKNSFKLYKLYGDDIRLIKK